MSLRTLPEPRALARPHNFQWDIPSDALARRAELPMAAVENELNTISIFDVIGEDWWTGGGFTGKRMSAALRSIGKADVTVRINSPGGDMFEGIAIYNLLREHPAKVTVEVMGLAASAASIIAMAADEIVMGLGSFLMIHNAWGAVVGNQADLRDAADLFSTFDRALVDIYEARTGQKRSAIEDMMAAETWMAPSEAVKSGFADKVGTESAPSAKASARQQDRALMARRQAEAALAKNGMTRRERMDVLSAIGGSRDAAPLDAARDAGTIAALRGLIDTMKG